MPDRDLASLSPFGVGACAPTKDTPRKNFPRFPTESALNWSFVLDTHGVGRLVVHIRERGLAQSLTMSALPRSLIVLSRSTLAALMGLLLTSCFHGEGHVGLVATGHFSAQQHFPTAHIVWCGETPPTQVDLVGDSHQWRLTATREFSGGELELDLANPGADWTITDGDGSSVYRIVPDTPQTEYTLWVSSEVSEAGVEPAQDMAELVFTTEALAEEHGIYANTSGEGEMVAAEDFPPEC